ncbi:LOW QUALITY PROTEIN: protein PLASTID MOVEMENT IMPAIRED 1-RELATED 2-like [Bidens hawaiensis]|uniref:LOW QUALITY PROTEIN: protein PLASTID MOVEMENT IMPAIRED 1-RELATED 2-like n=1 Tax=Bidens hawaiensis TaxID=980011 RepID=UPI00404A38FF
MMMRNEGSSRRTNIDDSGSSRLLHDIEEISKALYLREGPPTTSMPHKYMKDDLLLNKKKSSIWKWKPLKALTHIRNHRLSCSFFLHIHSIEGLPPNFNDLNLCVYWKRKDEVLKSQSIRVKEGIALFDETLIHHCSVYISKHDANDDVAKYTPKLSLLYASIVGAPSLDIGKHWIDLTRLLPITLTELEDEKNRHGKWITSFKLTGKAKGATINVSFGFSLMADNLIKRNLGKGKSGMFQRVVSIPSNSRRGTHVPNGSFDMKGPSIGLLYDLLDDAKTSYSKESKSISNEVYDDEFTVIDKGIEFAKSVEDSCVETINVADLFDDEVCDDTETEVIFDDTSRKEKDTFYPEESNEEFELFLQNLSISENPELDLNFQENQFLENDYYEGGNMIKSRSLDDLTNTVIHDFMNLVGFDSEPELEPESPREQLLKQFEKENLASGNFVFDLDVNEDRNDCSNIFDSSFLFEKAETERDHQAGPSLISRRKAKMLENLETETLMEKWGLNERAFQNSPRTDSGAFGSPVYLSPETTRELPSLGDGVGPLLKTESGGFLRSMNPLLFKRAKNGEKLVVQVSNTVVLPPAMGSDGMGILVNWASLGPEKMLSQVTRLMPLEVITGMSLQQAAWKGESQMTFMEREDVLLHELETIETQTSACSDIDSECLSLNNIILSTIDKIQYLLIEGLRIQSGISTVQPPSTISSTSTTNNNIEEILEMSVPLADYINSSSFDVQSEVTDLSSKNLGTSFNNRYGYFGNFMLALQILLRDPLRDYEPIGIPMLALLQVERSMSVDQMVKVNEVYVTGLKANLQKKQQSGSRWLFSSGMAGKTKKHLLTKSTALVRSSIRSMNKMKHDEMLWSISSYIHGEVDKWKELSGLSLYVRNPDIVFK